MPSNAPAAPAMPNSYPFKRVPPPVNPYAVRLPSWMVTNSQLGTIVNRNR